MNNQDNLFHSETEQAAESTTLMTPFALDSGGRLTHANDASRGNGYFCPACEQKLTLKRGKIKMPHFAHKPESNCSGETIKHQVAKLRVADAITNWKMGKTEAPRIALGCKNEWCGATKWLPLPDRVSEAVLELPIGAYRVDVALMNGETPMAAIEVKVSHAVDNTKAEQLKIPFIEVDADAVIDNPTTLKPIRDTLEKKITCTSCKEIRSKFDEHCQTLLKPTGLEALPTKYYRYAPDTCWSCEMAILVFAWPGCGANINNKPSLAPIPHTIQYRYDYDHYRPKHKRWTNICHGCNSTQAWWSLKGRDGPFIGLHKIKDFDGDMAYIVSWNPVTAHSDSQMADSALDTHCKDV